MTPSDFSVLLLAWDDADPGVAVLGGAALPPTLPLVYHLAAEQPVLAVFPHLPGENLEIPHPELVTESNAPGLFPRRSANSGNSPTPPETTVSDNTAAALVTVTTTEAELQEVAKKAADEAAFARESAGIRRLTVAASGTASAFTSVLVGLEDRAAATSPAEVQATLPAPQTPAAPVAASTRSQWPTGANAPQNLSWSAPAAPYLGASAPAGPPVLLPVPPLVAAPVVRETADPARPVLSWPIGFSPLAAPARAASSTAEGDEKAAVEDEAAVEAGEISEATGAVEVAEEISATETAAETSAAGAAEETSDKSPFAGLRPAVFEETVAEIGAAEANDLSAPEDDLTLDAPAEPAPAAEAEPAPLAIAAAPVLGPAPAHAVRLPPLDGLNARMIQYARQAAQLVQGRSDFGVIYAPSWPAWLAALEIRNSSRRPLVLYAATLAADFARPAERGWLLEVERMTLRRARLILVPTEQMRQQVGAQYGTDTGEVRVVPADDEEALRAILQELAAG